MRLGQQQAHDAVRRAGGDRFALYDLENRAGTPVYVHAKICIVDDAVDDLRLRQPQPAVLDRTTPSSPVHVVDPSGRLPQAAEDVAVGRASGAALDDPRLQDLGPRASSGRDAPGRRSAASDRMRVRTSHDGPGLGRAGLSLVRRPRRPTTSAQADQPLLSLRLGATCSPEPPPRTNRDTTAMLAED